jgi:hypothetical protein
MTTQIILAIGLVILVILTIGPKKKKTIESSVNPVVEAAEKVMEEAIATTEEKPVDEKPVVKAKKKRKYKPRNTIKKE